MTSNATCITNATVGSNFIEIAVNPVVTANISIGASVNPVCEGTSVACTAIPANGGDSPAYQWKVNAVNASNATNASFTYTPVNDDQVTCIITSNAPCVTGNPATSNTLSMTVNPLLTVNVSITASANPVYPGTQVTFTATPAYGGSVPAYQWRVNAVNAANATNASYTYMPANGDMVSCIMTSSELCPATNPVQSNVIIMAVTVLPVTLAVQNQTVNDTRCFEAFQTLTVAGNETYFVVQNGGSVIFVAGENILYYPGTRVDSGGTMSGYIAPGGPWCDPMPMVTAITGTQEPGPVAETEGYRIYPNPTRDRFFLEDLSESSGVRWIVQIYNMHGKRISTAVLGEERIHEFSLEGQPTGIYLVRIIMDSDSGTTRIIKQY